MKVLIRSMLTWAIALGVAGAALANGRGPTVHASLTGLEEVPAVFTLAEGAFRAKIDARSGMITYSLSYEQLTGAVQQAHLHFGEARTNGGIIVFLCTNLGNGPTGTQQCPAAPAEITGAIMADDVIGPVGQGITAGNFEALVSAIGAGAVYVNVHTDVFPGGEIRGQLR